MTATIESIGFTATHDGEVALAVLIRFPNGGMSQVQILNEDIAKVSLVGTGMKSSPGVAARAFSTLGENQINILAISTSPIRLSVVVDGAQAAAAVRCLHKAFDLDSDSVFEETQLSAEEIAAKMNKGR